VTGIVVAHRASTVLLADKVALLSRVDSAGATITHIGTHAQLLATVPQYRYLLAADDELDDGAERSCAWEEDEDRGRLEHLVEEHEPRDYVSSEAERR
jgi:ATP-binding cassette subfamily B protein